MDSLQKKLALKCENLALSSGLECADDGLEDVAATFVIDEFNKLDTELKGRVDTKCMSVWKRLGLFFYC